MSFKNKVAIVTGASSGIGAAIARKLAEEGAEVVIVGRNVEKLNKVFEDISKTPGKVHSVVADVTNDAEAKHVVDEAIKIFKKINILVNNAGVGGPSDIENENAISAYDSIMNINLRSVVVLTHYTVPHLIQTKGNIVNISSLSSTVPLKKYFAYATSKAALDHFSRCIALSLSEHGIRVNTVNPGPVKTDFFVNMGMKDDMISYAYDRIAAQVPLKRVCEAEEVADVVMFLASEKAKGVTGSSYVIDNGQMLTGDIK